MSLVRNMGHDAGNEISYENPHSRKYAVGIAVWRMGGWRLGS